MSNLKQIGLGFMMYVQDYDEHYPAIYEDNSGTSSTNQPAGGCWSGASLCDRSFWQQLIYPYTRSMQIAVCPSAVTSYTPVVGAYGVNSNVIRTENNQISMASVNSPASTYMDFDSGNYYLSTAYVTAPASNAYLPGVGDVLHIASTNTSYPQLSTTDFATGRHFNGVNMGFADGHVKWLQSQEVIAQAQSTGNGEWSVSN